MTCGVPGTGYCDFRLDRIGDAWRRHRASRSRSAAGEALIRHSSRNSKSYAQHPANGLWFHPVYDGSSESENPAFIAPF